MIDNNNKTTNKSTAAFRTYDYILAFVIVIIAVAYALINLYLYTHIKS